MSTPIDLNNPQRTFVTNFNADGQESGNVKLMTDEKGHMYPFSQVFDGEVLGGTMKVEPVTGEKKVTVSKGYVQIPSGDGYSYLGWTEAPATLVINDANTSRYTAIVAFIQLDGQWSQTVTNNPGLMKIKAVDGGNAELDESAIRADTEIAENPYIVLAQIYVPSGSSSVSVPNIIDRRKSLTLKQGVGLPEGSYASGLKMGQSNLKIVVIKPTDPVPSSTDSDLLVIRLAQ